MSESTLSVESSAQAALAAQVAAARAAQADCDECIGSGGWFRYEPALEPSPGLRYLSCVQCRGTGRTLLARA